MPEYEHFSFFQNVLFTRKQNRENAINIASPGAAQGALEEIIIQMGYPDLEVPFDPESCSCQLLLTVEQHNEFVPSITKPLRLGMNFTQVGGPKATARGDIVNE